MRAQPFGIGHNLIDSNFTSNPVQRGMEP